jgi:diaminopimelate decarboxylase
VKKDEVYSIVGKDVLARTASATTTPCYIYFTEIIRKRISDLVRCLPPGFRIHYAIKANPNPDLLRRIAGYGLGADVASAGELERAVGGGIQPDAIEFSGPGKTEREITEAVRRGIGSINADGLEELETIARVSQQLGVRACVGIRANPQNASSQAGMKMSGDTQFGIPSRLIPDVLRFIKAESKHLDFTGVHVHSGSQILSSDALLANFRATLDLSLAVQSLGILPLRKINFGGGWGISYFSNQRSLDLQQVADGLRALFSEPKYSALLQLEHIVEPGRFLVGECGIYVTSVTYRKPSHQREFLVVDGGMHQSYILAGGMGQVIRRNFELDVIFEDLEPRPAGAPCDVAGCLCTPQDMLATGFQPEALVQRGDRIVFFNCGAYGLSASPVNFLSHPPPAEVVI